MVADLDTKEVKMIAAAYTEQLGTDIAKACQLAEAYSVHLYGVEDVINTSIIPDIEEYLKSTYGENELEIEVN